jgi:hypothetical protein
MKPCRFKGIIILACGGTVVRLLYRIFIFKPATFEQDYLFPATIPVQCHADAGSTRPNNAKIPFNNRFIG